MIQSKAIRRARTGRALTWVLAIVLSLAILTGCGFGLLHLVRLSAQNIQDQDSRPFASEALPPDCEFTITAPEQVIVNEPFDLVLAVHNPTAEIRTLASVDLGTLLPGQFVHVATDPRPTTVDEGDDLVQLWLHRPISAGGTHTLTTTLAVTRPGPLNISLTCWFPETYAAELDLQIQVAE